MRSIILKAALTILSLQGMLFVNAVFAEGMLEEIVVTARKRTERIIDIPESIQSISAEMIKKAGISSLNDLGRQTPNVVLNRRQDNEPNVVIRGIGGFGNTQGIGFYIDDVQNFTDQSASIEDIERIEILKGPQGTLYGGSNVGGAVKLVTKKPGSEFGGEVKVGLGNYDTRNLFGAVNIPFDKDGRLAMRVSGYSNETDSFVDNTFLSTDNNPNASNETGVRVAFAYNPTEDMDIQLTVRHNELENGGNVYLRTNNVDDFRETTDLNNAVLNDRKVTGGILQVDYGVNDLTLTSLTSYTHRRNRLFWDLDYSSLDGVTATHGDRNTTEVFTQELRLASDTGERFDWIVGGYYAWVDNRGLVNNADVFLGVDFGGPLALIDFNNGDAREEQYALFGTLNYHFDRFHIGGGLRVNRSDFKADLLDLGTTESVKETEVLPKISLTYDIDDNMILYGVVARGYEPGRVNLTSGTGVPYESESALNYEIGIKGLALDRRLTFDLAGFYIVYQDRQFESQVLDANGVVQEEITNVGKSRSYGVEGGFTYYVNEQLTLGASAGYLDSEWKSATFNLVDYSDNTSPNAPEFSGNISLDYTRPISNNLEFGFRTSVSHMGSFYWDIPNLAEQDDYQLVDIRLSLAKPDAGWEFSLRVDNLFDEGYYNEFNYEIFGPADANGNCTECHLGAPGIPRTVLGTISYNF